MTIPSSNGTRTVKRRGLTRAMLDVLEAHPGKGFSADQMVDALPSRWLADEDHDTVRRVVSSCISQMPQKFQGVARVSHGVYAFTAPPGFAVRSSVPEQATLPVDPPEVESGEELLCVKVLARLDDGTLILKDSYGPGVWKATEV